MVLRFKIPNSLFPRSTSKATMPTTIQLLLSTSKIYILYWMHTSQFDHYYLYCDAEICTYLNQYAVKCKLVKCICNFIIEHLDRSFVCLFASLAHTHSHIRTYYGELNGYQAIATFEIESIMMKSAFAHKINNCDKHKCAWCTINIRLVSMHIKFIISIQWNSPVRSKSALLCRFVVIVFKSHIPICPLNWIYMLLLWIVWQNASVFDFC